ncbi:beta-N-acetylhexosaminidase [Streptomyces bohaiensis]|uniref:beta-N-acetylhexosaminidase n=1 Tax=Streptomyces bohaiensis TaxID=1431344 RepID=A0ABX1CK61_9ACTN|nr:beta-N-acetylhexosaminidase [Streptomyces bohaiensis]NJQ17817.1 beta-N-acetylhexosaminidase [Streptomyces bohaiensis]
MTSPRTENDPPLLPGLIPAPRAAHTTGETLTLDESTVFDAGEGTGVAARLLRAELTAATGLPLPPPGASAPATAVRLRVDPAVGGPEDYTLVVTAHEAVITGGGGAGVQHGGHTLRQLLGSPAYRRAPLPGARWRVPTVEIEDGPRFGWRGFMLDVSRHFMPKDGVLRYLDLLAAHKLNVFHLHLSDDQGWRVEIRSKPRLTEQGAWRPRSRFGHRDSPLWDEQPHGGFYTQDDLREIVAYAADRHITVVPEIDIPGHSQAAIAAYPELGVPDVPDGVDTGVWTEWGISPRVLFPGEETVRFFEDVFTELLEIFPGEFVHLGGDECPRDQWERSAAAAARAAELGLDGVAELQPWFLAHFSRWLAERGRRLIGWDEILESAPEHAGEPFRPADPDDPAAAARAAGLDPGAAVCSWRGYAGGLAAARAGHDVVMCPEQQVYLDYRQADGDEPFPIAYVRTLHDVYRFEPVPPELAGTDAERHVLGAQANLWTEVVQDRRRADYQAFPRLCAFAEVVWSRLPAPEDRDTGELDRRMAHHYPRLDALGVEYRPPGGPLPWQRSQLPEGMPGSLGRPREGAPPAG